MKLEDIKDDILKEAKERENIFDSFKENVDSIKKIYESQQVFIAAYSSRIEKKENAIEELTKCKKENQKTIEEKIKLLKAKDIDIKELKTVISGKDQEIRSLIDKLKNEKDNNEEKGKKNRLLEDKEKKLNKLLNDDNNRIDDLSNKIKDKDIIINQQKDDIEKKENIINELKIDSDNYNSILTKQQDFIKSIQSRELQVCEKLIHSFQSILNLIRTDEFNSSPFRQITFNKDNILIIISAFQRQKDIELKFWDYLECNFSDKLFEILNTSFISISKIFKLYLYCQIENVHQDLMSFLDTNKYCESVNQIESLFAIEGIYIHYPTLLFDKYKSDLFDLENYNILGQINGSYIINAEYNTIIDLEQIGVAYKNNTIKPKVSKKN